MQGQSCSFYKFRAIFYSIVLHCTVQALHSASGDNNTMYIIMEKNTGQHCTQGHSKSTIVECQQPYYRVQLLEHLPLKCSADEYRGSTAQNGWLMASCRMCIAQTTYEHNYTSDSVCFIDLQCYIAPYTLLHVNGSCIAVSFPNSFSTQPLYEKLGQLLCVWLLCWLLRDSSSNSVKCSTCNALKGQYGIKYQLSTRSARHTWTMPSPLRKYEWIDL